MKYNKRVKILRKVIQRICDKKPEIQKGIDASMIEEALEKAYLLNRYFLFLFFFAVVFIIMGILEKNLNKSVEDMKDSLWKF